MAVTGFQSEILKRLARLRIDGGETYIAALEKAADRDCDILTKAGYDLVVMRKRDYIVEVRVSRGNDSTELQWVRDSAYRFFPLIEDELLGLTLHPFDLAVNKLLALAGRRVPRDWVDTITCSEDVQPLGFLACAANGKDRRIRFFCMS